MPTAFTRNSANLAGGNFVPEVWSKKLQAKFYASTSLAECCNTDWEGEIKEKGSKVMIRVTPTVIIGDYTEEQKITYQDLADDKIEMTVDKAKFFAFKVGDIDKAQSDIKVINEATGDAAKNMKISVEKGVYGSVYASATQTIASLQMTKLLVLDWIVDAGVALAEKNAMDGDDSPFILIPPWVSGMIKKSDLKDASISGDGKSTLRTGRLGMIDNFTIYVSNNLAGGTTVGSPAQCMAGTRKAISFASQFTKTETLRLQETFGDAVRGLNVYGFKVTQPDALVSMPCYK